MPLTDTGIRNLKKKDRNRKYADGGGLFLEVLTNGRKVFRYAYRLPGKKSPKEYTIGDYPDISLARAREERDKAADWVRNNKDPVLMRKLTKTAEEDAAANTFRHLAEEWLASETQWTESHRKHVERAFRKDIYPAIGHLPISDVDSGMLLDILRAQAGRGAESYALQTRQWMGKVFQLAVIRGLVKFDPSAVLKGVIKKPREKGATAHKADVLGDILGRLDSYGGLRQTVLLIRLMMHTFVRTTELVLMEWEWVKWEERLIKIPAGVMKMRLEFWVPISDQAYAILHELRRLTGRGGMVFPNQKDPNRGMSRTTINRAMEYMKFPRRYISGHDFRASASTWLNEQGYNETAIERQLAHVELNASRRPYNQAEYLDERRKFMQAWADYLASLQPSAR